MPHAAPEAGQQEHVKGLVAAYQHETLPTIVRDWRGT